MNIRKWFKKFLEPETECDFTKDGKCRYVGFQRYPPSEYNLTCVCCQIMETREVLEQLLEETRNLAAALTEVIVLLLKDPKLKKLGGVEREES